MPEPLIVTVPILPMGMVNSHILIGTAACVLIDTGIPGSEGKIARALKKHGRKLGDVTLIIVTHAHTDHAGSAARLRELTGAPILAHAADLDYYEQRKPMTYCVAHWWGPLFLRSGVPTEPYQPFMPDILLQGDARYDLRPYGVEGSVQHTPGHTAGSVSVELTSGDAMVGDLLASGILMGGIMRKGHATRPPFEDDPRAVGAELLGMIDAGMERFHLGHGGPLMAEEVRRHALALQDLAAGPAYAMTSAGASAPTLKKLAP
jgi:glyoxylase-like metal-dependent hydrolase (beta-lactamase superfamily II)